ncbi:N-acetyltransferase family protein [Sphingomonas sp. GlSt437]|uniref:GNAT family N-acetyltransferase n=1 Tax=Sphingomonas sp. GlSt437 TaxID=3389970 RepID=UPI003A87201B
MSTAPAVRQARPADAARIGTVHAQAWREAYAGLLPAAEIAQWTAAKRVAMWRRVIATGIARGVYVAELNREIIGFGACADQRSPDLAAQGFKGEVTALYVLQSGQRSGAGRALMAAMARRLIAEGDRAMALWVLAANAPARRFYEALGGRAVATHRRPDLAADEVAYGWDNLEVLASRSG